jgi:hypothetical protein
MSNPVDIQSFYDELTPILSAVDEILNEWNGEGCLQFPVLMGTLTLKLNWEGEEGQKIARAKEPIIREYVRTHQTWYVTRGAHGGIMRRSEKQKKDAEKAAKDKAKAELTAALEAELARKKAEAAQQATVATPAGADTTTE